MTRCILVRIFIVTLLMAHVACDKGDTSSGPVQPQTLEERLALLPGASVTEIEPPAGFNRAFEIVLPQPVDHNSPTGQQFNQRIFVSHRSESSPTVFIPWGYTISRNNVFPMTELFGANQILMDHRYFGDASPVPIVWEHMNVVQAAADCHRVCDLLAPVYTGPWISHGISKGGGTALIHRRFYPDDVVATIAQVAPIMFDTADTRFDNFLLNEVGDALCRTRLQQFQRLVLSRRADLMPMYEAYASQNQLSFRLGLEAAFEINTLEFLFYFWQYGPFDCSAIPDSTFSSQEIFEYLQQMSNIEWLRDGLMDNLAPAWYQLYTELGYYRLIEDHVSDVIETPYQLSYSLFCPQGIARSYDPTHMYDLVQWLQTEGDNILYIYGEYDPNTACAVALTGQSNALKIILPGGNHLAGFDGFGPFTAEVHDSLESWTGITIDDAPIMSSAGREEVTGVMREKHVR
ncbi:MAG: hypothetical protein JSU69_06675 [Candidatus Zixiibacteriota bacterium]|nr:MAG: hypothetical protein JSU69_06675 [candidate division Zixibacteria bacterium]